MSNHRPLCSGFRTVAGVEYEIQVFSSDEGFAEEVCVNVLLEDGTTAPYEPTVAEEDAFQAFGQEIYDGWIEAGYEL